MIYYISKITSKKFKFIKKEHIGDVKYNRKITTLTKFYQEETIQVNLNERNNFAYLYSIHPLRQKSQRS